MKTYYQTGCSVSGEAKQKLCYNRMVINYVKMEGKLKHVEMGKYI